jgi:hypothetical protein
MPACRVPSRIAFTRVSDPYTRTVPILSLIRGRRRTLGAAAALVAATVLVGACGDEGSNELSSSTASSLRSSLERVEQNVDGGDCTTAAQQAAEFSSRVDELPARVDEKLRDALASSASRLETLVADRCRPEQAAPSETPTVTTPEEPPQPEENQGATGGKGKKPKKEKKKDQGQSEPPPDTGGAGEEVPPADGGGGVTTPGSGG